MTNVTRLLILAGGCLLLLLVAIHVVPYGRQHDNPPVRQEPAWDSPQTRALAGRACYDCHSNEKMWTQYSPTSEVDRSGLTTSP
jgi:hypothetical protein